MDIQPIDNGTVAIYIEREELQSRDMTVSDITMDEASQLLHSALHRLGRPDWNSVCFELFPGCDSLLLFARRYSCDPVFFIFDDIEELIDASAHCPGSLISFLTYFWDAYVLTVYPWESEPVPPVLYEYGTAVTAPPGFALHVSEHGRLLAGPSALRLLHETF
jgi:hypothetical protein